MRTLRLSLAGMVILALLGGSSAIVAAQEEPTTEPSSQRTDILPGARLVVDEIEPGVFHVLSDDLHVLSWPIEPGDPKYYDPDIDPPGFPYWYSAPRVASVVANDEGVWLGRPDGIVRLGEERPVWAANERNAHLATQFQVAPDGTVYQRSRPRVLGANGWQNISPPRIPGFDFPPHGGSGRMQFAPDGSLWVQGSNGKDGMKWRDRLARRDADGWSLVKVPLPVPNARSWPGIDDWQVADDGVVYVWRHAFLQRYDGTHWRTYRPGRTWGFHAGGDGSLWAELRGPDGERLFRRLDPDGSGWTTHEVGVAHPLNNFRGWTGGLSSTAGLDGAVWYVSGDGDRENGRCDGVARHDGTTTTRFLRDLCVYDIAVGPGGDVWVLAGVWRGSLWDPDEVGPVELYVVTAEAVAAAE